MMQSAARLPRVLVVEDDPALSRAIAVSFERYIEVEVVMAADARRAIEILETRWVDLVCLDLMLPEVSGFSVFEHIRRSPGLRDLPVVVMSGRALPEDRARALELGAQSYLVKPFPISALRARVAALLAPNEATTHEH